MSLADMSATCGKHACLSRWHLCRASLFRLIVVFTVHCCSGMADDNAVVFTANPATPAIAVAIAATAVTVAVAAATTIAALAAATTAAAAAAAAAISSSTASLAYS
jgi:hypothetical protein